MPSFIHSMPVIIIIIIIIIPIILIYWGALIQLLIQNPVPCNFVTKSSPPPLSFHAVLSPSHPHPHLLDIQEDLLPLRYLLCKLLAACQLPYVRQVLLLVVKVGGLAGIRVF